MSLCGEGFYLRCHAYKGIDERINIKQIIKSSNDGLFQSQNSCRISVNSSEEIHSESKLPEMFQFNIS